MYNTKLEVPIIFPIQITGNIVLVVFYAILLGFAAKIISGNCDSIQNLYVCMHVGDQGHLKLSNGSGRLLCYFAWFCS